MSSRSARFRFRSAGHLITAALKMRVMMLGLTLLAIVLSLAKADVLLELTPENFDASLAEHSLLFVTFTAAVRLTGFQSPLGHHSQEPEPERALRLKPSPHHEPLLQVHHLYF